jgi:hypothetical protein
MTFVSMSDQIACFPQWSLCGALFARYKVCFAGVEVVLDLISAGLIQDYRGLLICRFFLGLFEGALQ